MKKFLRTLMLAALLLPFSSHAQNTLTVADGTATNSNVPIHGLWADAYLRCQTIYPANEISASAGSYLMTGGSITSLTYYLSSIAAEAWTGTWEVKVMETTATTLSAFVDMTGATTVYTGTLDGTVSPMTITFTTPYTYNGGNLIIEVSQTTNGNWKSASFYGISATGASWQGYNSSAWASITGSVQNFIPKTTFTFTGGTQVTCAPVENLAVSNITSTGATLTWSGNASGYTVYEYANADSNGFMYTDTVANLNTLLPNTEYTFGVVADCGADGESAMRTITFRTACGIESMPWSENFDTWTSKSPCWSFLSGAYNGGTGTPSTSTSAWNLTSSSYGNNITISGNALAMNIYSTYSYWAVTPLIEITNDALLTVDVAVAAWSAATPNYDADDTLAIAISTDGGTTFTTLRVLNNTELNALTGTFSTLYIPVTGYTNDTVRFAIFGGSSASGGDNRIAIDNITVTASTGDICYPPTNLTADSITETGATLTWVGTATSYNVYTVTATDTTLYQNVTDTTLALTGLTAMTNYTYGVRAVCGSNESAMVTVSFATACAAVAIPFTEDFETTSTTLGCWSVSNIDANTGIAGGGYAYSGATCFVFSYNTNPPQYLISPELSGTDNGLTVSFMYKVQSATYPESFQLGYSTTTNDVTAFTWGTEQTNLVNTTYTSYSEILPAGVKYVAIKYTANDMYYLFIDSMAFGMPPSCLPVTNLAVDSTTTTSVFLSWNGTATAYNIYSATGAVIATGVTATNYEVTGLTAMSAYTFGVTAVCGTEESPVVTVNALTACTGDPCFVEINGVDSYGDGWNGNAINVMQAGLLMGTFTVDTGSLNSAHITVCSGAPVTLTWNLGMYPDEASFEIKNGMGMVVYTGVGTNLADGDTIITLSDACPSCLPATNLTVDAASETSVTISWTGSAASYDVYNGTTFVANVTTNTYTFTGLTVSTGYTFGVQAICSATDTADMVTINANTGCSTAAINLPFTETFNATSGTRNCWTTIDADNDGNGWTTIYGGYDEEMMLSFSYDNDLETPLTPNNWLISPKLHSNAGSNVTMEWTVAAGDATYNAEHYGVYVSTTTTDTAAFTLVQDWTLSSASAQNMNIDLSAYAGQDIYVAFRHFNCTDEFVLIIDDVNIYEGVYVPDTLTVIFQVDDATMGTTIPAPGTYYYTDSDNVSFGSQANAGYRFLMWEMTVDGETDTLGAQYANGYYFPASAFLADGSNTVIMKAYFEAGNPDSTTITYAVNDATMGTITPAPGTYTIYVGNTIGAEATANAGYELNAWVFDIYLDGMLYSSDTIDANNEDFDNPMVFGTLPQSFADYGATITVTAVFAPATVTTYTVIVRTSNGEMGNVNPVGINTVNAGESFTVTAYPNTGYHFVSWTMGDSVISTANPYTFTVTGDTYLAANFAENDSTLTYYTLTVSSQDNEMGSVSCSVPAGQVAEGTVVTVTATANEGYRFCHWVTTGGVVVSTENPYTFTMTEDVTLTAMFERVDGIDDVEANDFQVYTVDNRIVVKGVENMSVYVYDVTGRSVKSVAKAAETVEFTVPSAGVYLVKAGMAPAKRVVVVR